MFSCNQRSYTCKVTAERICQTQTHLTHLCRRFTHCVGKCAGNSEKVVWIQVREQPKAPKAI